MRRPNFLLGYGERLVEPINAPRRNPGEKRYPYTFGGARRRLAPQVEHAVEDFERLPAEACPRDESVGVLTLHPAFLAKSYYPADLLASAGMRAVGSRPRVITPEKWTRKGKPEPCPTTELFVAAKREDFEQWAQRLPSMREEAPEAADLTKLESVRAMLEGDRLHSLGKDADVDEDLLLEVVLHADAARDESYIVDAFAAYASDLGAEPDLKRLLYASGLCFLPMRATRSALTKLARFSFLRVMRPMPTLRPVAPTRSAAPTRPFKVKVPAEEAVNPSVRVAVFDGGMGTPGVLRRWVNAHDAPTVGSPHDDFVRHGRLVTSALLFGALQDGVALPRPYGVVDHFRVLDSDTGADLDLYDVLHRIKRVLDGSNYKFVNLSIGPELPIDDDDVHAWTAVLDEALAEGRTLAAVAVGNGGLRDAAARLNRIMVPADAVNALAVGAASSRGPAWRRAEYSSVGPGRSPGLVKPDVVSFGGYVGEPFWMLDPESFRRTCDDMGTSFATPAALRMAVGIHAHFGDLLSPLALKALLVHCADHNGHERHEVGWGRVPDELENYVVCPEGSARILYQGELTARQYVRAPIPIPQDALPGIVTIRATFCYSTGTDADHPGNYTRAGLEVVFRPHDERFDEDGLQPRSDAFFQLREFSTEQELRHDAHKWETTLHRERRKRGTSLRNPVFDVHYNARDEGRDSGRRTKIKYALVVTVIAPRVGDLYDRVVRQYGAQIQPLLPVVQIPIRART